MNLLNSTAKFGGNCTMLDNFAELDAGGLMATSGSTVYFTGGETVAFRQNVAGQSCGGFCLQSGSSAVFNGSVTFQGRLPAALFFSTPAWFLR